MNTALELCTDDTIERLNALLRVELAAMNLYQRALRESSADRETALRALEEEHREAADALREQIANLGGLVSVSSIEAATQESPLAEVEQAGIAVYESTLTDAELDPETRALIQSHLLPKTKAHVPMVEEHFGARLV